MHLPKKGLRVFGIAESYTGRVRSTLAGVVMRKDLRIDGFSFGSVAVGGMDATDEIIRMIEILKQDEHKPMPFEKQIAIIFAGTSGYLDDVPVPDIRKFEDSFIKYLETLRPEILTGIRDKKEITDDLKKSLVEAIGTFKKERL